MYSVYIKKMVSNELIVRIIKPDSGVPFVDLKKTKPILFQAISDQKEPFWGGILLSKIRLKK